MDKTIWFAVVASGVPNFATADASKKMCIFFVNGARRTIAVVLFNGSGNNIDIKLCMDNMMFSDTIEKDSIISYVID